MNKKAKIYIDLKNPEKIKLLDFNAFFYDLNILYDCILIAKYEEYSKYRKLNKYNFYKRHGKRINNRDALYITNLNFNSPIKFSLEGLADIIPKLAETIERIFNFGLNRNKLKLENEEKEIDIKRKKLQLIKETEEIKREYGIQIRDDNLSEVFNNTIDRMGNSSIEIENAEFEIIEYEDQ
jgi:hypothetical protein